MVQVNQDHLIGLAVAVSLGFLIGIQRGWVNREKAAGSRIAGVRTHALIALLGGLSGLLATLFSELILGFVFIALAIVITAAYISSLSSEKNHSITSHIGMLITFALGALATLGMPVIAASSAVITTFILDNKKEIHGALSRLQENELDAGLKLLLISVVMLPLLPNEGYGPWQAINPYEIWWMVVLIASISFVGYFAMKVAGAEKGILFTSLFAGLSSSTALTLHFSRLSRENNALSPLLASGILAACGTMFPRVLLVCFLINPDLFNNLWPAISVMAVTTYIPAFLIWRMNRAVILDEVTLKQNPLELSSALFFGAILLSIVLLAKALNEWFGDAGVLILAAISGITDVDAITLTLSRQSENGLALITAALGITIAASVNSIVKAGMALFIGDRELGIRVTLPLLCAVVLGISTALLI